jgi:DDE superfamily endonuclease
MAARRELLAAIRQRYGAATREEKGRILDELVAVAGYHRKHAIRVLRRRETEAGRRRGRNGRRYDEGDREALIAMWEASDRICSKRLKPLIPVLLPAVERHGRIRLADDARARLLAVSAATMDRLLSDVRLVARGGQRRRAGFSSAVRRTVPVRTFGDWNDPPPGYAEVDLRVHHAKKVKAWAEHHRDAIELFYLPAYAPEHNPDEYLNNDVKQNLRQKPQPGSKDELLASTRTVLRAIQRSPVRIRSYFRPHPVRYAA